MSNHTTSPQTNTTANNTVFLPWEWTIVSTDPETHTCPSVSGILTTFAVVNVAASFLSIIFGHRRLVNKLTKGKLGKPFSKNWKWTWIITVGLNLLANAIIGAIIKHSAGYAADFKLWQLMLFLLARPRLSWIVLGFAAGYDGKKVDVPGLNNEIALDEQNQRLLPQHSTPTLIHKQSTASLIQDAQNQNQSKVSLPFQQEFQPVVVHEIEYDQNNNAIHKVGIKDYDLPWVNTFLSGFIAEVLMQLAALYVMGVTVKFAWQRGYYNVGFNHKLYK
jgi:hypothetical protein